MKRLIAFLSLCLSLTIGTAYSEPLPPFYEGIGSYKKTIDSSSDEAQKYFTQGIIFLYGYNYPEAVRSFHAATECDPHSGICYWGETVSIGECIVSPGDEWSKRANHCMEKAHKCLDHATDYEKEIISTLKGCYREPQIHSEIAEKIFVENMKALYRRYPDDPDITAVYANSAMKHVEMDKEMVDGKPTGTTKEIVDALEEGMRRHPYHPGLNHFYIHAMENCRTPEKALGAAERLDGLVPLSGHLQHMPAHIYAHFGRYHDASGANQRGVDADLHLFKQGGVKDPAFAGFYLHNHYYLFHSLSMEGRSKDAITQARAVLKRINSGDLPSNEYLQNVFVSIPYLLMGRFGMWEAIDKEPAPDQKLVFATAMWDYAQGLSQLHKNNIAAAEVSLQKLYRYGQQSVQDPSFNTNLGKILEIAYLDLEGQLAFVNGNFSEQIENLEYALTLEQSMYLGMLPWYMPVQQAIGAAYLKAGMPEKAEQAFKEDLKKNPNNGWSLYGLKKSLQAQNRSTVTVDKELQAHWKYADISLVSSRF